jgi:hypothetical protein
MKQLIEDLISVMEYHVEQTRPIYSTTVALQAAREALRAQPAPVQEPVECQYGNGGYACCEGGPCKADEQNNAAQPAPTVQEPVADNLRAVEGLLLKFQSAVSNMARTYQEYMGKAMGDETYARFAKARDETIPALRAELLKLYTTPPAQPAVPLTDEQIDKAAMKLAECMDYPWAQMPEKGKQAMRNHAKAVIEAAAPEKGQL